MKAKINQRIDELEEDIIKSIQDCVKIPSVTTQATEEYPFGKEIDNALKHTLKMCESMGFKTTYKDGHYGYAEIGEGEELIGIVGHLDVVPEGEIENWTYPPYEAIIEGGKLYGRGTQDDKGPTIACIHGIKALIDLGVEFNKRVRFIFGTDEENLWRDIDKYKENGEEIPDYGFTPDSTFPMIYAEKCILQAYLTCNNVSNIKLSCGGALNLVPDKAEYSGKNREKLTSELEKLGFEYTCEDNKVSVIGNSVHSAISDTGINAISRLCIALNNICEKSNTIKFVANVIGEDANANKILENCIDDVSGKLTFNVANLELNDKIEKLGVDIRIPVTYKKEDIVTNLKKISSTYNLEYNERHCLDPIYISEDNFLVKILRKVYEEETGLDSTPISSGGGTYARAFDNFIAFGSVFPGKPETEHQTNEFIEINDIIKAAKIYSLAVYELLQY
ncbi:MAG: M20 family metallopeptidase [Methanobacteriaceae archaeon]|nr:M20 family metallopeptidase [Methanobacteriaceae archaeon]